MLYQNQLLGPRRRSIHVHVDIIGLVLKMGREFLVQMAARPENMSTLVNAVGVATTTEDPLDTTFNFETLL